MAVNAFWGVGGWVSTSPLMKLWACPTSGPPQGCAHSTVGRGQRERGSQETECGTGSFSG